MIKISLERDNGLIKFPVIVQTTERETPTAYALGGDGMVWCYPSSGEIPRRLNHSEWKSVVEILDYLRGEER